MIYMMALTFSNATKIRNHCTYIRIIKKYLFVFILYYNYYLIRFFFLSSIKLYFFKAMKTI